MFKLEFETSNAAFHDDDGLDIESVADVLRDVVSDLRDTAKRGRVFDINGNTVGRWELSED